MDMLDLQAFPDGHFSYVLDKGSFDALCCDTSQETKEKIDKYLKEIFRVLNNEGQYLVVSLL